MIDAGFTVIDNRYRWCSGGGGVVGLLSLPTKLAFHSLQANKPETLPTKYLMMAKNPLLF